MLRQSPPNSVAANTIIELLGFTAKLTVRPPNRVPEVSEFGLTSVTAVGEMAAAMSGAATS